MSQQVSPEARSAAPKGPVCSNCKVAMRVTGKARHQLYADLDEWIYRCDCGRSASRLSPHRGIVVKD